MIYKKFVFRLAALLATLFLAFIIWQGLSSAGSTYVWHWNRVWRHFGAFAENGFIPGPLLIGIFYTIGISACGLVFSFPGGLFACAMRLSPWPLCALLARVYIALWRNTPLLLQLFMAYFLFAPLLRLTPFWTAILALSLFEGAYFAEIFRGAILAAHRNQWEAALSLGFNLRQSFILVILPQALRHCLPSLVNQAIAILKDSTLVSAIAVADLTMQSQSIISETFLAFEIWLLTAAIYLALALLLALPGLWLEKHGSAKRSVT